MISCLYSRIISSKRRADGKKVIVLKWGRKLASKKLSWIYRKNREGEDVWQGKG